MRSAKVIYNLFRKYCNIPKFFATKDLNGITKGKYLSGNNFDDVDIDFEIVSNSEVPRTPYAMQQALTQLMQYTGGIGGLIQASQMNPEMTSSIATTFGAKLPIPKQTDIARVCRKRIEQAKKLLEMELQMQQVMQMVTGQPVDNADLSSAIVSKVQPPISPFEPFFQQKVSARTARYANNDQAEPTITADFSTTTGRSSPTRCYAKSANADTAERSTGATSSSPESR